MPEPGLLISHAPTPGSPVMISLGFLGFLRSFRRGTLLEDTVFILRITLLGPSDGKRNHSNSLGSDVPAALDGTVHLLKQIYCS